MKKDNEIYTKEELEIIKNIESDNYQSLSKEEFLKEKKRFQKIATNTIKKLFKKSY